VGERPALVDLVPYITKWSAEQTVKVPIIHRGGGIGYADERPGDRDKHGVLWARDTWLPGQGRPEFAKVHPGRQRRAMTRLLCQVCGGRADRTAAGMLWLIGEDPSDRQQWPAPLETSHPPVCAPCAVQAVRACPHLRCHHAALRVRTWRPVAVRGTLYAPWYPGPLKLGAASVYLDDWRARWLQAGQLIIELQEFSTTTLDTGR
jgi:hypothetical protein